MAIYKTDEGNITNLTSSTSKVDSDLSVGNGPTSLYADTVEATIGRSLRFSNQTDVDDKNTPYTITDNDIAIMVDTTVVPININISGATQGRFLMVKDVGGSAGSRNITFSGASIDGGTYDKIATNYGGVILYLAKNGWAAIAKF